MEKEYEGKQTSRPLKRPFRSPERKGAAWVEGAMIRKGEGGLRWGEVEKKRHAANMDDKEPHDGLLKTSMSQV